MPLKKNIGVKALMLRIPADLHEMLKRMAVDNDTSVTHIITDYLRWLQKQPIKRRKPINEDSITDYELDVGNDSGI
jgi:hypothetical protein